MIFTLHLYGVCANAIGYVRIRVPAPTLTEALAWARSWFMAHGIDHAVEDRPRSDRALAVDLSEHVATAARMREVARQATSERRRL